MNSLRLDATTSNTYTLPLLREQATRQRVLGADLSLLRIQDKSPQTRILVSSSIGKRLNRQRVLGVAYLYLGVEIKFPVHQVPGLEVENCVFFKSKDRLRNGKGRILYSISRY